MQILNLPCDENHMILEFLKAEKKRLGSLSEEDISTYIDHGNTRNEEENTVRRKWLWNIRWYGQNRFIFRGLDSSIHWHYANITTDETGWALYINDPSWFPRNVKDMVQDMVSWEKTHEGISALALYIRDHWMEQLPKSIILIPADTGEFHILEWHHRLIAFFLAVRLYKIQGSLQVIIGCADTLKNWSFY